MTPAPGDFGVTRTGGLAAAAIRWGTNSPVNHAFIYIGHGKIIEADPHGARVNNAAAYPGATWSTGRLPALLDAERKAVVEAALHMAGTPYGWADIAAITLAQKRLGGLIDADLAADRQPWIVRRLCRTDRLICSQLVDLAYERAGLHLYDDGRLPGLVSPGDLLALIRWGVTA